MLFKPRTLKNSATLSAATLQPRVVFIYRNSNALTEFFEIATLTMRMMIDPLVLDR